MLKFSNVRSRHATCRLTAHPILFSRSIAICILVPFLAITIAACDDGDDFEVDEQDALITENDPANRDRMGAGQIVAVSIMNGGTMMPTLPAGPATLTIDNTHGEECTFSMEPMGDVPMASSRNAGGQDASSLARSSDRTASQRQPSRPGAMSDTAGIGGTTSPSERSTAGQRATMPAETMIAAGEAANVSVNLEPGVYEMSCDTASGTTSTGATEPLVVMVSETVSRTGETGSPYGTSRPRNGTRVQPDTTRG